MKGLIAFLLFVSFHSFSQSTLHGIVRETGTQQPLPFVNVYLASTSFGATSGIDGKFSFKVNERGKYELICSYVGYRTFKTQIVIDRDSTFSFEFTLDQKNQELNSIVIRADTSNRKKDFKEFKRIFLGETTNASSCKIKNPKDIYVYSDKAENVLVAYSWVPIIVENKALGHVLYYDLEKFEVKYSDKSIQIWGTARYEDLPAENDNVKNRRISAREECYQGSIVHFMRSLISNRLKEEGWDVSIIYPVLRPSDSLIRKKLKRFKDLDHLDSIEYYNYVKSLPPNGQLISLPLHGREILSKKDDHKIDFRGTLTVVFKKEYSTMEMPYKRGSTPTRRFQTSEIYFLNKQTTVYDNGYYEPQNNIILSGNLSTERTAEFLPYNYKPLAPKKSKKGIDRSE